MRPSTRPDTILHPIRVRIVFAVQGRRITTAQIHRLLPDVPLPTLYRHLRRLTEGGIVHIVETRQVGSNHESVYALVEAAANLTDEEIAQAAPEDHLRYFTVFVTGLLSVYDRYLQSAPDVVADKVMYYAESVCLTDSRYAELRAQMRGLIENALHQAPEPGARRRTLAALAFPEADPTPEGEEL
jgi:DNA-binding transcriptional ArsR family regulator